MSEVQSGSHGPINETSAAIPGSERPKQPTWSPLVKGAMKSCFCFSLPNIWMGPMYRELLALMITPAEAQPLVRENKVKSVPLFTKCSSIF